MNGRWVWLLIIVCCAIFLALALTACEESFREPRGKGDAPISGIDDKPARVLNFPNGYPNVAFKCLATTGVYTATRANDQAPAFNPPPVIIPRDPACTGQD